MACGNCGTSSDGTPRGCQNNGTCGTDGCNKLTVFDWLANMSLPAEEAAFDCVEVRFKNARKEFYRNEDRLPLAVGDVVATQAKAGHDIGIVTLTGPLVRIQMDKKKVDYKDSSLFKIYRKANQKDIEIWQNARNREEEIKKGARELAIALKLEMKLSDVEFQGDASKATFYYTSEERVDFRQLIKDMAKAFNIRIEMRQIGLRQEAQRLGGIGSCGRELCCSTWLTDFRSVGTAAARYQQLSLNPQKLAGQCGKLKCCLNYELDVYVDALKDFPAADTKLRTEKGIAYCQKVDIFKEKLWFTYRDDPANWHMLTKEQVLEILEKNKNQETIASVEEYAADNVVKVEKVFENVVGQDSLTRFDAPKRGKSNNKRRNKSGNAPQGGAPNAPKSAPGNRNNPKPEGGARPPRPEGERTAQAGKPNQKGRNNGRKRGPQPPKQA